MDFWFSEIDESLWSTVLVAIVAMVLNFRGSTIIGHRWFLDNWQFFGCIVFSIGSNLIIQHLYSWIMDYWYLLCGLACEFGPMLQFRIYLSSLYILGFGAHLDWICKHFCFVL
jgi:hypothetical protein